MLSVSRSPSSSSSSLPYGPEDGGFSRSLQSALDRLGSQQYGLPAAGGRLKREQQEEEEGEGEAMRGQQETHTSTVSPPRMSEVEKRL
jgi:hypothetical protein